MGSSIPTLSYKANRALLYRTVSPLAISVKYVKYSESKLR